MAVAQPTFHRSPLSTGFPEEGGKFDAPPEMVTPSSASALLEIDAKGVRVRGLLDSWGDLSLNLSANRSGLTLPSRHGERSVKESRDLAQALYVAAAALGRTPDAEGVVRVTIAETRAGAESRPYRCTC